MWYRVFGSLGTVPDIAGIERLFLDATVTFQSDATGWYRADVFAEESLVTIERFLADEDGIRAELNAWAAHLETLDNSPNSSPLMERAIQTQQLFTIRRPTNSVQEGRIDRLCEDLARHLAAVTDGFYQADSMGFFNAKGEVLVPES